MPLDEGIVTSIVKMKEKEELCDIVILVEDEQFPAHKLLLAASSAFFHAMFTSNFKEKDKDEVRLEQQSADCFAKYLQFIYDGQVELTLANVEGIYGLATFLQGEELMRFCEKYLSLQITVDSCISYLLMSNQRKEVCFYDKAIELIAKNFRSLSGEQSFYNLNCSTLVDVLKQGDNFDDSSEEKVLEKVMAWLANSEASTSTAAKLFEHIRWGLFQIEQLESLQSENPYISRSRECMNMLNHAIEYLDSEDLQPLALDGATLSTPRGLPVLAAFGGVTALVTAHSAVGLPINLDKSEDVLLHKTFSKKRPSIAELPVPMQFKDCYSSVVVNNILFVVGGCISCSESRPPFSDSQASQYLFKYTPLLNRWKVMSPMITPRAGHSTVAVQYPDGLLVIMVIGGCHISFGDICPVEVYDIFNDSWSMQDDVLPGFPRDLYAPAACVHKGSVYVSGGENEDGQQKYMYRFNPGNDRWERLSDMIENLSGHGMFAVKDKIYIVPLCMDGLKRFQVFCFDPEVNQHSEIMPSEVMIPNGVTWGQTVLWKEMFYTGKTDEKHATYKIERKTARTTFREEKGQDFRFHYCSGDCDGQCSIFCDNYRVCTALYATLAVLYLPHESA